MEQLSLSTAMHWQEQGAKLRKLLEQTVKTNGLSLQDLELETGIDERQIARSLARNGGAHPPLALLAALMHLDRAGVLITGLAGLVGYEAVPKKPDVGEDNRRMRAELAEMKARLEKLLDQ